jgi:hypothetical protein
MGLAPDCDYKDIRTCYKSLSKQYHPDTTKLDGGEANKLFLRLQVKIDTNPFLLRFFASFPEVLLGDKTSHVGEKPYPPVVEVYAGFLSGTFTGKHL